MSKIVITTFYGKESLELAHLPFVVANEGLNLNHEVQLWLLGSSVNLCRIGFVKGLIYPPYEPIEHLISKFLSDGGKIFLCGLCLKNHAYDEREFISGVGSQLKTISFICEMYR